RRPNCTDAEVSGNGRAGPVALLGHAPSGTNCRPRHQHRRGRGVPGRRDHYPPSSRSGRNGGVELLGYAMTKPRILIIEDERALTDVLSYTLQREGYEPIVAHDGQEGLRKAQTLLPDAVLLDLMLPVRNGLEVCRELRAGESTHTLPIIMLTAKAEETD